MKKITEIKNNFKFEHLWNHPVFGAFLRAHNKLGQLPNFPKYYLLNRYLFNLETANDILSKRTEWSSDKLFTKNGHINWKCKNIEYHLDYFIELFIGYTWIDSQERFAPIFLHVNKDRDDKNIFYVNGYSIVTASSKNNTKNYYDLKDSKNLKSISSDAVLILKKDMYDDSLYENLNRFAQTTFEKL